MSHTSSILTRKFGLQPRVPGTRINLQLFSGFAQLVNTMIKAGLPLDAHLFENNGLPAVKNFYDTVRRIPTVHHQFQQLPHRERARRCAAQPAFFCIQQFKRQEEIIQIIAEVLLAQHDLTRQFERRFPNHALLQEARDAFSRAGLGDVCPTREVLRNEFCHVRNLLLNLLRTLYTDALTSQLNSVKLAPTSHPQLVTELKQRLKPHLKSFFRRISWVMTRRIKRVKNRDGVLGTGWLDSLIARIFDGKSMTIDLWNTARKTWRNHQLRSFAERLAEIDLDAVVTRALKHARERFNLSRALHLFFKPHRRGIRVKGATFEDFNQFLGAIAVQKAEQLLLTLVKSQLMTQARNALKQLQLEPWKWLKRPQFQKQTIPLGIDDGQVYELEIRSASGGKLVFVRLSLVPHEHLEFKLKTPERFFNMVDRGYQPLRGSLAKQPGGGLVLAIPFAMEASQPEGEGNTARKVRDDGVLVAGFDPGLKTFGTVSIAKCIKEPSGSWKRVNATRGDLARYFLDPKQLLLGNRTAWFAGSGVLSGHQCFNVKRRLVELQKQAWQYQSKLKRYAANHHLNYRHKVKYQRLRREWKRVWRKIKNLHLELARQLATRVIAACQQHAVEVLRLEDLSWAKHSDKNEVGYFLATWQVHWFFAKVQALLAPMAERNGIQVEWVKAKNTSQRCSRCGNLGTRMGKKFKCPQCGLELDSDLNAARNIQVAPLSLAAIRGRGGCPLPPTH